jgi:phosphate:Na+ symporter
VVVDNDEVAAQNILHMKNDINQLVFQALQVQAQRLKSEGADNIDVTHFENELIDSMKRIYTLTKRIAKLTLPDAMIHDTA